MQLMLRRSVFNVQTESANMNFHKAYKSCFVGMLVFLLSSHIARKSKILMAHNFLFDYDVELHSFSCL